MVQELWSNAYSVCALDYSTIVPTITITNPYNGYASSLHSPITITVTASSSDATITQVQFFDNGSFLGQTTTAPFTFTTNSLSVGSYTLTAVAQDSRYSTATSAAIQVTVDPLSCKVTYQVSNQQNTTFSASVTITNTGAGTIVNWALLFDFPGNQQITQLWGANFTQNANHVDAFNPSYSPNIPPNGQASFGFNASFSGTNANPTSFQLNNTSTCTVG
jgi:cellulase/cellobiase CelA1